MIARNLNATTSSSPKGVLGWLWHDRWPLLAWLVGIPAGVYWVYSGMPMICH